MEIVLLMGILLLLGLAAFLLWKIHMLKQDIYGFTKNLDMALNIMLNGEKLELNKKEYALLKYFMQNPGKVLSREVILLEVWGYEQGETRTLDNHISRLRKLGVTNLETVFGVGYRLTVQ